MVTQTELNLNSFRNMCMLKSRQDVYIYVAFISITQMSREITFLMKLLK